MKKILVLFLMLFTITLVSCDLSLDDSTNNDSINDNDSTNDNDSNTTTNSNVKLPKSSSEYKGTLYTEVEKSLKDAGFTNIEYSIIYDLTTGWLVSDGEIETVSIDGKTTFSKGTEYAKDVKIIITYHTFESNKPSDNPSTDKPTDKIEDTYDDSYQGEKYNVNIIVDFDGNLFLDIYDIDLRIDGRKFETLEHGVDGDYNYELKPGEHTISFTKIDDTSVYGQIKLNVSSDLEVTYRIKGHTSNIDLTQVDLVNISYYTISFDSKGGSNIESIKIKAGEKLPYLSIPKKEGYYFEGWKLNGVKLEYPYTPTSDLALVAEWTLIPECEYEYAFERECTEYSIYILFDIDTKKYIYFATNDTYVERGTYTGDLESFAKVELVCNLTTEQYHQYFQFKSWCGYYYDFSGFDWEYDLHSNPWQVEAILNDLIASK